MFLFCILIYSFIFSVNDSETYRKKRDKKTNEHRQKGKELLNIGQKVELWGRMDCDSNTLVFKMKF